MKGETPKTPLALINRNTAPISQVQASTPGLSMAEATAQLNEVQRKLIRTEIDFQKLARKHRKTKAEMTKFGVLSREIDRLQVRKNDYAAIIAPLAPVPRQAVKPEPIPLALVPLHVGCHPPAQLPLAFHNPAFGEQQPIVHQRQPIASGSNIRLPDVRLAHVKMDVDDDGDDDGMSSDGALPEDLRAAMGPAAASLGGYGENFDADGNFHGRGRDRFAGPQANPDEYAVFWSCNRMTPDIYQY
jgi:hypothetical protein